MSEGEIVSGLRRPEPIRRLARDVPERGHLF
jgi:hypothetical protein